MQHATRQSGSCDVLLIEAEEATRSAIRGLLDKNLSVRDAWDARTGEAALREGPFRLVVFADDLPDLPGLMLMAQTQDLWPTMQRILMCRNLDGEFLLHALKSGGVLHYLPKPLDLEATRRLIAYCLDQNRLLETLLRTQSDLNLAETRLASIPLSHDQSGGSLSGGFGRLVFWATLSVLLAAALILLLLTGIYLIKSSLGIDYFPDNHLEDLLPL